MTIKIPAPVPEIPVKDLDKALSYYRDCLGFNIDWGGGNGLAGISRDEARIFLADSGFRSGNGNNAPSLIWLNLNSREEVDQLYEQWHLNGALVGSAPESKPWNLHEFTIKDIDENIIRVFYDFNWELSAEDKRT